MNYIINKEEYQKNLKDYQDAINALEEMKILVLHMNENYTLPTEYRESSIQREIEDLDKKVQTLIHQHNCRHESNTDWVYTGHDSHKSYYEKKCINCGVVLEEKWD